MSIWTELSKQLENKITAKALYTFVKLNRHNIWTALGFTHESDNETSGSSDDTDFEPGSLSPRPKDCWTFDLEVPFQKWIEFMPETVQYKNKISKTQKKGIHNIEAWHLDACDKSSYLARSEEPLHICL